MSEGMRHDTSLLDCCCKQVGRMDEVPLLSIQRFSHSLTRSRTTRGGSGSVSSAVWCVRNWRMIAASSHLLRALQYLCGLSGQRVDLGADPWGAAQHEH